MSEPYYPEKLSEIEIAFNQGLQAAIDWHEKLGTAAMNVPHSGLFGEEGKQISLQLIGIMSRHRAYAAALRAFKYVTRAEKEERDQAAEIMNR